MNGLPMLLLSLGLAQTSGAPAAGLPAGHPPLQGGQPPTTSEVLQQLDSHPELVGKDKSFEIAAAIGKLYALSGRYKESVRFLRQAVAKLDNAREVYLKARPPPSAEPPTACQLTSEAQVEVVAAQAVASAKRGDRKAAGTCAREALAPGLEAETWLGNVLFLSGDAQGALVAYARVLEVDPVSPGALYGRAGVHFDAGDRKAAAAELQRYLQHYPDSPHAAQVRTLLARAEGKASPLVAVVKQSEERGAPPLSPELIEAVQRTPQTPEFLAGLEVTVDEAEAALAQRRFQDALDRYKRVMPYQPNNGRFRAGMAWALVGLDRQPMAERIWSVAVDSDPASVEQLGDALARRGDAQGAQSLYAKLAHSAPSYAQKSGLMHKQKE